jgi:hypothetical protein
MAKSKVKRYSNDGYVTSEDSNYGMKEAYDDAQAESRGEEILKGMRDEATTVSRATPKIVTKEELAKSGLSLRDYMNKQQGLKPRGDASSRQQINFEYLNTPSAKANSAPAPSSMSMKDKITKEAIDSIKSSGKKYPDMSALQAPAKRAGMTAMGRKDSGFDLNSDASYKKGGSVSSASRRADGIAMKGKTRGKIC